jgi:uncharacterized protein YciU (UPF0263 family)
MQTNEVGPNFDLDACQVSQSVQIADDHDKKVDSIVSDDQAAKIRVNLLEERKKMDDLRDSTG